MEWKWTRRYQRPWYRVFVILALWSNLKRKEQNPQMSQIDWTKLNSTFKFRIPFPKEDPKSLNIFFRQLIYIICNQTYFLCKNMSCVAMTLELYDSQIVKMLDCSIIWVLHWCFLYYQFDKTCSVTYINIFWQSTRCAGGNFK